MRTIQEHGLETPTTEETQAESDAARNPAESESPPGAETSGEPLSPSAFELVHRILIAMVQAIEDGADLLGASIREELGHFRADLVKILVGGSLLAVGAGLLTAGLALWMRAWIGSWPPVLLLMGAVFSAAGGWLFVAGRSRERS